MNDATQASPQGPVARADRPLRIVFVVTCLDTGGAEVMLWKLLSRIDRRRFDPSIIALSAERANMVCAFRTLGIDCELLGLHGLRGVASGLARLCRILRERKPDIVQGWMYHGNIAATLGAACARLKVPVLWNVRATLMERRHEKPLTLLLVWLGGKLSRFPAAIVNNSRASALQHEIRMGYSAARRHVLPNGFDADKFQPSRTHRVMLRQMLGVSDDALLIGHIARYHPMKGHALLMSAAARVAGAFPNARFVCVGDGVDERNGALARLVEEYGLRDRVRLLGERDDVHAIVPGLDILVSASSSGEGFPNVVGEAMCCGVPCVVTDVGDCADIVGDTGFVVPPADAEALARTIADVIALGPAARAEIGARARARVIQNFTLPSIVRQYENLYERVVRGQGSI